MNLNIMIKCLGALVPYTNTVGGSVLGADALALQQKLEMLQRDPQLAGQINQALAQAVCGDWATFEEILRFTLACLTQGKAANMQSAWNTIGRVASQVATQ